MSIILDYKSWGSVNEGLLWDVVEREPVNGTTHKVKVKYVDSNNIKVKAVNDYDMVKQDGTIDPNLPAALVTFLKTHDGTDFAREYPQLQDINSFYKDNFFTYNVKKESDRRQVVIFSLQKRTDFKGITPDTKLLSDAQATQAAQTPAAKTILGASDASLSQSTAQAQAQPTGPVKLEQPVAIANLGALGADTPLFKMIDSLVAGLSIANPFTDPKAKEILGKAADELSAKKIGDNASALIKGLMAGIGVNQFTDKYGRKKDRTLINQFVVDKLATLTAATATPATTAQNSSKFYLGLDGRAIFEQEEDTDTAKAAKVTLPSDFKMDEFLKAIGGGATAAPTTGDIKVPDGGFVKGKVAKGDAELKKVQQLIIDKFAKKLANSPVYKKFAGFGADGAYGPTTEKLIAGLKAGFGLSDKSGSTITAELITKIQTERIDESYLTLTGSLVEGFDVDAYSSTIKSYMPSQTTSKSDSATTQKSSDKTSVPSGFNVDKIALKMFNAICGADEKEEVVYEIFEDIIKSEAELNSLLKEWKLAKLSYTGLGSSYSWVGTWKGLKEFRKDKSVDPTKISLEHWLNNLFNDEERKRVNTAVAKYSKNWKLTA
jgi:hypothetical protein